MNATAATLLRGTAWCARARARAQARRIAGAGRPAGGGGRGAHASGERVRARARALRQTDADTDDEFVTMTDVDVNRGSRLAQQVRANPTRCLRTRRVRRDSSLRRRHPNEPIRSHSPRRRRTNGRPAPFQPPTTTNPTSFPPLHSTRNPPNAQVRLVQWYPGHIARAEKALREQLKAVDAVVEVRDIRIPLATTHPDIPDWIGNKLRVLVLNRADMVTDAERSRWVSWFKKRGEKHVVLTDMKTGKGVKRVMEVASSVAKEVNEKRVAKGLLPGPCARR